LPEHKKLPSKLHTIYNILKFKFTLDMMCFEKNAKDLKLLTGGYLIKTLKDYIYQKPIGHSDNK